jgi:hypothetical protein
LPIKNDWLSAFLDVIQVTENSNKVYIRKIIRIRAGDIFRDIFYKNNEKNPRQKILERFNITQYLT